MNCWLDMELYFVNVLSRWGSSYFLLSQLNFSGEWFKSCFDIFNMEKIIHTMGTLFAWIFRFHIRLEYNIIMLLCLQYDLWGCCVWLICVRYLKFNDAVYSSSLSFSNVISTINRLVNVKISVGLFLVIMVYMELALVLN